MGHITVVFLHALGVEQLLASHRSVAQASLQVYHRLALRLAVKMHGYVAELSDGLCLMAFSHPAPALVRLRWLGC